MKQGIVWLKEQMKNKKFCWLLIFTAVIIFMLVVEFHLFSYDPLKIVRYVILLAGMFFIAWIDQYSKRIPNKILLLLLGMRIVLLVLEWIIFPEFGLVMLFSSGLGLLLGGGMFLIVYFLSRGGIGIGDVKLFAVLGSYVGGGSILAVAFLTAAVSAIYSIVMLILKKLKLKEEIPFAPFILIGTILTMALGM